MLSKEQREERKTQVGASEVYKLFNFNNKTAIDLWELKCGFIEDTDFTNDSIEAGNILEEVCLMDYFKWLGNDNYTLGERVEHPKLKNFVASLDAYDNEMKRPVENKVIQMEKLIEMTEVPKNYYIQVQCQIACKGTETGEIVFNGITEYELLSPLTYIPSEFKRKVFVIESDLKLQEEILSRVEYFLWCVEHQWKPSENEYQSKQLLKVM